MWEQPSYTIFWECEQPFYTIFLGEQPFYTIFCDEQPFYTIFLPLSDGDHPNPSDNQPASNPIQQWKFYDQANPFRPSQPVLDIRDAIQTNSKCCSSSVL